MQKGMFGLMIIAFAIGWVTSLAIGGSITQPIVEQAQETIDIFSAPEDVPSPSDTLTNSEIHVLSDRVEITIDNAIPAIFTDTNSMDPVIDEHTTAIEVTVTDPSTIQVGDIVSYETPLAPGTTIIHRVVEIGEDSEGTYFIFKGDNNPTTDPGKVRPEQLRRKVVGLLY
jgi:hypothetical protein